ncbi:MAG: hypothetical protein H0V44_02705 [Planctomycetes bacterium]|nr:hypothetical protein [Planctomycetota bacterium]
MRAIGIANLSRPAILLVLGLALIIGNGALVVAADAPPGIAVVEAFVLDGSVEGQRIAALAGAIASEPHAGIFPLIYRIATNDPAHDRFAAKRGTVVERAHEADAGHASALVIGGRALAVDASDAVVGTAIAAALATAPRVNPDVRCERWGDVMWIGIAVPGAPEGAIVTLAVVEDGIAEIPGAGSGPHQATVRTYKTVAAATKLTDVDLSLPPGLAGERTSVIAVVYDAQGMVLGAARCVSPSQ